MAHPAPHLGRIAISLLIVGAAAGGWAEAQTLIFEDGFETGDTSRWAAAPPVPTPTPTPTATPTPTFTPTPTSTPTPTPTPPTPLPVVRLSADATTVVEGSGEVTLLVELTDGGAGDVQVDWSAVAGTATEGSDFSAASGTLTLNGAVSSAPITVTVIDDQAYEYDEQFTITLTGVVGGSLTEPTVAVVTITDDDEHPTFSPSRPPRTP